MEVFYDTSTDLPEVNRSAAGELIAARNMGILTSITMHGTCDFHSKSFRSAHGRSFAALRIPALPVRTRVTSCTKESDRWKPQCKSFFPGGRRFTDYFM